MKRRTFLQATLMTPVIAGLPVLSNAAVAALSDGWRTFELVTKLEIANPERVSRAWVPLPYALKTDWHMPLGNTWSGNGRVQVVAEPKYGAEILYVEWQENEKAPLLEVVSRFATRDRTVDFSRSNASIPRLPQTEIKLYTEPADTIPPGELI